jgi:hypothetical protein
MRNQLDEGILFLASKGKESGTWRVNFTLILVLKTLAALKKRRVNQKSPPSAPFESSYA